MIELIENKSWLKRNWKWFTLLMVLFLIALGIFFTSGLGNNMANITKAYADPSLYENALKKAQKNEQVKEVLGSLNPIDNMAILEGFVEYSSNNNSVNTTIRVKGSKGKAKMDISAYRNGEYWEYKKINIRIKEPKEIIEIIKN